MPADPTNWAVPDETSIKAILDANVFDTLNETISASGPAVTRVDKALEMAVARIRGAVQRAGRFPLSLTDGSVPPDAEAHAAALAVQVLSAADSNLAKFVIGDPGTAKTGLARMIDEAEAYVKAVGEGAAVMRPNDPTGQDYATAVAADNPAIRAIRWFDSQGTDDQYESGDVVDLDMNTHT